MYKKQWLLITLILLLLAMVAAQCAAQPVQDTAQLQAAQEAAAAAEARAAGAMVVRHIINRGQGAALKTGIDFALPQNAHVKIEIFNVLGQKVMTLVDEDMEAGYKSVTWNGVDSHGKSISSGVYLYKMEAGDKVFTKKMLMLK